MNEIVMGKKKKVEDSVFVTEIEEGISIIGKPDVAKNPMTGELERILYIIVTDKKTYCPTVTDTELCIYSQ